MGEALDFTAYRKMREAAEGAELLLLRLRAEAFAALEPGANQADALAEIVKELETAPEFDELRRALGRTDRLPGPIRLE